MEEYIGNSVVLTIFFFVVQMVYSLKNNIVYCNFRLKGLNYKHDGKTRHVTNVVYGITPNAVKEYVILIFKFEVANRKLH